MKKQDDVHQTACMNANETNKESNDKMLQIAADFAENNAFATPSSRLKQVRNRKLYYAMYAVTQLIGIVAVVLTCVWLLFYKGGFAWRTHSAEYFNWHIIIMLIGIIYLPANGLLLFKTLKGVKRNRIKLLHTCFGPLTMLCIIYGTWIAVDTCNIQGCSHWYTLHSWMAIIYAVCFLAQWICGLVIFYTFCSLENINLIKRKFIGVHSLSGITIFLLSILVGLLGFFEEYIYKIKDYPEISIAGIMMNIVGILLTLFAFLTVYLIVYIRP